MIFSQLRYFQVAAKYGNFTKAAEKLYMTQPALSKAVSALERELGVQLFFRIGKNIELTQYGEMVLEFADQVFTEYTEFQAKLQDRIDPTHGLAAVSFLFADNEPSPFMDCISGFMDSNPNIFVHKHQQHEEQAVEALKARRIDMIVSTDPIEEPGIECRELFSDRLGLIVSTEHVVAGRPYVPLSMLGEFFYVSDAPALNTTDITLTVCQKAGFVPKFTYVGNNPSYIGRLICAQRGVYMGSESVWRSKQHMPESAELTFVPIGDPPLEHHYCVNYLKNNYRSVGAQTFLQYMLSFFGGYCAQRTNR